VATLAKSVACAVVTAVRLNSIVIRSYITTMNTQGPDDTVTATFRVLGILLLLTAVVATAYFIYWPAIAAPLALEKAQHEFQTQLEMRREN
jgi:predicted transporter